MQYSKNGIMGRMALPAMAETEKATAESKTTAIEIENRYAELDALRKGLNAESQKWVVNALADMAEESAKHERNYLLAMFDALAAVNEDGKKIFPHVFKAYERILPLINCAYLSYTDTKTKQKTIKFVIERQIPHDEKSLMAFSTDIKAAERIVIDKPLKDWLKTHSNELKLAYKMPSDTIMLVDKSNEQIKQERAEKKNKKRKSA